MPPTLVRELFAGRQLQATRREAQGLVSRHGFTVRDQPGFETTPPSLLDLRP
jgi:hypothetical protein